MKKLTDNQIFVLQLAEDGEVYAQMDSSRNGGRGRTVSSLKCLKLLDWQSRLTDEGRVALSAYRAEREKV